MTWPDCEGANESDDNDSIAFAGDTFAFQDLSIRSQRKQIRHELTDPYNRLHSIALDAEFVKEVSQAYPDFAVVANLRCGQWYVDPDHPQTSPVPIYFKSTDGHIGQWSFNLRRPNLGLLNVILSSGGAIIADSTRRGKRYPDALSKTLPIWCSVVNRALCVRYGQDTVGFSDQDLDVFTPTSSVSDSERDQIRHKLKDWAQALADSTYPLPTLKLPLRPLHVTPATNLPDSPLGASEFTAFYPVICLSASRYIPSGSSERLGGFNYVPGSGDDHESWLSMMNASSRVSPSDQSDPHDGVKTAENLRYFGPTQFWRHKDRILSCTREELLHVVKSIMQDEKTIFEEKDTKKQQTNGITVGAPLIFLHRYPVHTQGLIVHIEHTDSAAGVLEVSSSESLSVKIASGAKKHLQIFTTSIDTIIEQVEACLMDSKSLHIVLDEETRKNGDDFAVGILLITLALFFDDEHQFLGAQSKKPLMSEWPPAKVIFLCRRVGKQTPINGYNRTRQVYSVKETRMDHTRLKR